MKKLLIILLVGFSTLLYSQEIKQNNVYLEIAGASMFYSVNYERLWFNNGEQNMTTRLGLMYLYTFDERERAIRGTPLSISYLRKIKKNYFEAGISFAVMRDTYPMFDQNKEQTGEVDELILMPSLRIGIRHQPVDTNFFWNVLAQASLIAFGDTDDYIQKFIRFPLSELE
jgi:hypothetical protein